MTSSDQDLRAASTDRDAEESVESSLYFFPDQEVSERRVRAILAADDAVERAWVISHLLRYAQWDDIWTYVDRDEVCRIFERLDLPDSLRAAWARMLKIEAPVG